MSPDILQWHRASLEALAALGTALDRLHINNMNGEEDDFIQDVETAITMLTALPINRAAVAGERFNTETTPEGEQFVMPGCEREGK